MKEINFCRVIFAGFIAGIVFLFMEVFVEGFAEIAFGISEYKIVLKYAEIPPQGLRYYLVTFGNLFFICIFTMGVYAAIRPRFSTHISAALAASLIFWVFFLFLMISLANSGMMNIKLVLPSLVFNLIEFPTAIVAASFLYKNV